MLVVPISKYVAAVAYKISLKPSYRSYIGHKLFRFN
jgi:hypothetical protein